MGLKDEARHHAEIAAAAAQRPEEVLVLRGARRHQIPVGQHDIRLDQVVDGQPVAPREIAMTAAQREAADTGRRDDPRGDGQSECMRRVIHLALGAAAFRPYRALCRIDPDSLLQGEVNHQSIIAAAQSRPVVAAAANGSEQVVLPTEPDGGDHIRHIGAARYEQGLLVDHAIVQPTSLLILGVAALKELTAEARLEILNFGFVQHVGILSIVSI